MTCKNTLYCSFCGSSQYEVQNLIARLTVFICDECIWLCVGILRDIHPELNLIIPTQDFGDFGKYYVATPHKSGY